MAVKLYTAYRKTVSTAGTRVQLQSTNQYVLAIIVQAELTNSGNITVGDDTVVGSPAGSRKGIILQPGQSTTIDGSYGKPGGLQEANLADVYIDADANSQVALISYLLQRP